MDAPTVQVLSIDVIVSDPKIRRGRPVIKGTGIRVMDIAAYHIGGDKLNAEQLADAFRLDLGTVHAVLAYYYLHREEIDADIHHDNEEGLALARELEAQGRKVEWVQIQPDAEPEASST
jgi:uncharacterized protein (DUF433 family)